MKLSVIVPAFNEAATIRVIIERLLDSKDVFQVVVVDDASRDDTARIVKSFKHKKLQLVTHSKNMGKGAAIITGLKHVTGDYVLIQDADLEYDPREIPIMIAPINLGRATVVFGSRFLGAHTNMFYWHLVGNKFLNFVINVLFNTILSDMETCYKVMPTALLRQLDLKERDFRVEPEITCKLLLLHQKILEVPITYVSRTYAEGKKITWRDGFLALSTIFRLRLGG